eukprot:TRINITY_DN1679_c0_g1_i3.p1 TRINITY_DN1679_c0_g1~~TRINITY_DN1679_c0_g1_i3.p1  ORF type:complete len:116 (+),score=0.59 TRINITY_DN1679_c0_g1_i3:117-464(+)
MLLSFVALLPLIYNVLLQFHFGHLGHPDPPFVALLQEITSFVDLVRYWPATFGHEAVRFQASYPGVSRSIGTADSLLLMQYPSLHHCAKRYLLHHWNKKYRFCVCLGKCLLQMLI